jgi:CRP-like cAMP-binding protein
MRSSTAVTRTDAELVKVDRKAFTFMVQERPFFALEVMRTLADRLRRMNERFLTTAPGD